MFADATSPLRSWFLAIYSLSQHGNGIPALALRRQLGAGEDTARLIKHNWMQARVEREACCHPLSGYVQRDDALGVESGRGRGRPWQPGQDPVRGCRSVLPAGTSLAMRREAAAGLRKADWPAGPAALGHPAVESFPMA
ncbi:hypothetical protein ACFQGW_14615 [Xanthomonas theicola]|uniref:hypothetical protein n=1 Tax=Xanthomonas theicola TaxID=56464 RepID=UPI003623E033